MSEPLAVVIVTHNSARVVADLLDSIPPALAGLGAETIVVDNGSTDDTCTIVGQRADTRLLKAPNRGYSAGINAGVANLTARGPVVVLNPDVRLRPGCLRVLAEQLAQPDVGVATPRLLDETGELSPSIRREPTLLRALGLGFTGVPVLAEADTSEARHARLQTIDWATGAVMVVSRACHEALHGWDETFFLYSEETDFCLRARDAGYRTLFVPSAVAVHIGGQSGTGARLYCMQILNRVRLYTRRHGRSAAWCFFALAVVRETMRSLRGDRNSRAAARALLWPRHRPPELGCSARLLPC